MVTAILPLALASAETKQVCFASFMLSLQRSYFEVRIVDFSCHFPNPQSIFLKLNICLRKTTNFTDDTLNHFTGINSMISTKGSWLLMNVLSSGRIVSRMLQINHLGHDLTSSSCPEFPVGIC